MKENKLNKNQFYISNYGTMENIEIFKDFNEAKENSINCEVYLVDLNSNHIWEEDGIGWNYNDCSDLFLTTPVLVSKCPQCKEVDVILEKECVCIHCDSLNRKNDYLNGVVEITKENIHLYYEFMSDEQKNQHRSFISDFMANRALKTIPDVLEEFNSLVDMGDYKRESINKKTLQIILFGVKDTLKPIDEYIAEIKESEEYKSYLAKKA